MNPARLGVVTRGEGDAQRLRDQLMTCLVRICSPQIPLRDAAVDGEHAGKLLRAHGNAQSDALRR